MGQSNARRLRNKISSGFIVKFLWDQLQVSHSAFVKRPRCRLHQSGVNSCNVVPFLLASCLSCKMKNGRHNQGIFLHFIWCKKRHLIRDWFTRKIGQNYFSFSKPSYCNSHAPYFCLTSRILCWKFALNYLRRMKWYFPLLSRGIECRAAVRCALLGCVIAEHRHPVSRKSKASLNCQGTWLAWAVH